jgi:hypothetical protein
MLSTYLLGASGCQVESYIALLTRPKLPSVLLRVICWVIGEFGVSTGALTPPQIVDKLSELVEQYPTDDFLKVRVCSAKSWFAKDCLLKDLKNCSLFSSVFHNAL